jgi:hypothetical protein
MMGWDIVADYAYVPSSADSFPLIGINLIEPEVRGSKAEMSNSAVKIRNLPFSYFTAL